MPRDASWRAGAGGAGDPPNAPAPSGFRSSSGMAGRLDSRSTLDTANRALRGCLHGVVERLGDHRSQRPFAPTDDVRLPFRQVLEGLPVQLQVLDLRLLL